MAIIKQLTALLQLWYFAVRVESKSVEIAYVLMQDLAPVLRSTSGAIIDGFRSASYARVMSMLIMNTILPSEYWFNVGPNYGFLFLRLSPLPRVQNNSYPR